MPDDTAPRFLSRRMATGQEILGDRYGLAAAIAYEAMNEAVDGIIRRLCSDFNLTEIQAHIVWGELLPWLTDPDRIAEGG